MGGTLRAISVRETSSRRGGPSFGRGGRRGGDPWRARGGREGAGSSRLAPFHYCFNWLRDSNTGIGIMASWWELLGRGGVFMVRNSSPGLERESILD